MTLDATSNLEIIEVVEDYLSRKRPPEHIRSKLDLGYRIEKQSVIIFEIRPGWRDPKIFRELDFAKATLLKRQNIWKVYWIRGNLKWFPYEPKPGVKKLSDFVKVVEDDNYGCFMG